MNIDRKIRSNASATSYATRDGSVLSIECRPGSLGRVEQVQPRPRRRRRSQCDLRPRSGGRRYKQCTISDDVKTAGGLSREKSVSPVPRTHLSGPGALGQGRRLDKKNKRAQTIKQIFNE